MQDTATAKPEVAESAGLSDLAEEVAVITLFGATGAGKSTFANLISGEDTLLVGHGIESCTQDVGKTPIFKIGDKKVLVIDCPGFDDSHASDSEILKRIAGFLAGTWRNKIKLAGVLYLHRITDNRFSGASRRNFRMFRKMCGTDSLKNVVVVTNMWSQPPTELQLAREDQLKTGDDAFAPILAEGAQFVRHSEQTRESAFKIIGHLLKQPPVVLDLSVQLVDKNQKLEDTSAGLVLSEELSEALRKHAKDIEQLKQDQAEAIAEKDKRWQKEIAESEKKSVAASQALERQIESLKEGHFAQQAEWQKRLTETQAQYAATLAEDRKKHMEDFRKVQAENAEMLKSMKEGVQPSYSHEQQMRLEKAETDARILREQRHMDMLDTQRLEHQKRMEKAEAEIKTIKDEAQRRSQADLERQLQEGRKREEELRKELESKKGLGLLRRIW